MTTIERIKRGLLRLEDGLLNYSAPVLFLLICGLIVLDLLQLVTITIPIVGLILILLLLPYIQYIQRVKWGPFEAELDRQIEEAQESVRRLPEIQDSALTRRQEIVANQLNNYLQDDPKVAVAALWIEIEETLRNVLNDDEEKAVDTFQELFNQMQGSDIISQDMYRNIRRIRDLRNEALHGGEITQEDARRIIDVGIAVLSRLYGHADLSDHRGLKR